MAVHAYVMYFALTNMQQINEVEEILSFILAKLSFEYKEITNTNHNRLLSCNFVETLQMHWSFPKVQCKCLPKNTDQTTNQHIITKKKLSKTKKLDGNKKTVH